MSTAPQTSVDAKAAGIPGQTCGMANPLIEPAVNGETSASIPFGVMVQQSAQGEVKLLTGGTNKMAGIVVHDNDLNRGTQVDDLGVMIDAMCSIARRWRGYVLIEVTVAVGDAVRTRHTATGNEQAGAFRNTADVTDCFNLSSVASWREGGTASGSPARGVALLEIDMTNAALIASD